MSDPKSTNHQRSLTILFVIIAFLAGATFAWGHLHSSQREAGVSTKEGTFSLSNSAECESGRVPIEGVVTGPFRSLGESVAAGEAIVTGSVVARKTEYFGKEREKVYLRIASPEEGTPEAALHAYFLEMREGGNTVNLVEDGDLLFTLGELEEEGSRFSSTASISPRAREEIMAALGTAERISLRIHVPLWVSMDAPSDFSFACAIEFVEG